MYCMEEKIFITSTHWSCLLFASVIYLSLFFAGTPGKTPDGLCRSSSEEANPEEAKDFTQKTWVFRFHGFFYEWENSMFVSAKNMWIQHVFNMFELYLCLNYKDTDLFNMFEINSSLLKPVLLVYMYDVHDTIGMVLASIRTKLNSGRVGIMWFCDWVTVRLDSQRNQFFNVFDIDS